MAARSGGTMVATWATHLADSTVPLSVGQWADSTAASTAVSLVVWTADRLIEPLEGQTAVRSAVAKVDEKGTLMAEQTAEQTAEQLAAMLALYLAVDWVET